MPGLFDISQQTASYVTSKLINPNNTGGGGNVPGQQNGTNRIPVVTGLKLGPVTTYLGGTQYALLWDEPPVNSNVSHYNVFVVGVLGNNQSPLGPFGTEGSPCYLRLVGSQAANITFYVQTVLSNGGVSALSSSPSVTAQIYTPAVAVASGTTANLTGPTTYTALAADTMINCNIAGGTVTLTTALSPADGQKVTLVVTGGGFGFIVNLLANAGQQFIVGGTTAHSIGISTNSTHTLTYSVTFSTWAYV